MGRDQSMEYGLPMPHAGCCIVCRTPTRCRAQGCIHAERMPSPPPRRPLTEAEAMKGELPARYAQAEWDRMNGATGASTTRD